MTTPRPKRWFYAEMRQDGVFLPGRPDGYGSLAELACVEIATRIADARNRRIPFHILETLDEEQERRLAAHDALVSVFNAAIAAKHVTRHNTPRHKAVFTPRCAHCDLSAAIAAAETALGRKP
mgnify:CR=1 FL=1